MKVIIEMTTEEAIKYFANIAKQEKEKARKQEMCKCIY